MLQLCLNNWICLCIGNVEYTVLACISVAGLLPYLPYLPYFLPYLLSWLTSYLT